MLTKEEARQFQERWRLVNARTIQEVRDTPPEEKLRQTAMLFEGAHLLDWAGRVPDDEGEVRARWILLKERLGV
jgi:hypothetical protein